MPLESTGGNWVSPLSGSITVRIRLDGGRILHGHGAEGLAADGGRTVGSREGVVDHLRGRGYRRGRRQGAVHHLARGQGAGVIIAVVQCVGPGATGFIEGE